MVAILFESRSLVFVVIECVMARIIRTDISKMQSDRVFAKDNNFIDRISALKDIGESFNLMQFYKVWYSFKEEQDIALLNTLTLIQWLKQNVINEENPFTKSELEYCRSIPLHIDYDEIKILSLWTGFYFSQCRMVVAN
jgi:hypothetical protein